MNLWKWDCTDGGGPNGGPTSKQHLQRQTGSIYLCAMKNLERVGGKRGKKQRLGKKGIGQVH